MPCNPKARRLFSICAPNARLYIQAYLDGKHFLEDDSAYRLGLPDAGSIIDQAGYIACTGESKHAFIFDEENLLNILKISGFSSCSLRDFDPRIDLEPRRRGSIFAIAYK